MQRRGPDYWLWFCNVAGWDGCLPALLYDIPQMARETFPEQRGVIEWLAVVLPIAAFFLRCRSGIVHIAHNGCDMFVRQVQGLVFAGAVMSLILIDAVLILSHLMPADFLFESTADIAVWIVLGVVYLASMTFAMYPGCGTGQGMVAACADD